MSALMTPLREEHQQLLPEIEALRTTAELVGTADTAQLVTSIGDRVCFLRDHLAPHAAAEDEVLYPVVARLMGADDATATMRRDHVEVLSLAGQLEALHQRMVDGVGGADLLVDLRGVLYGLYAVIRLHFAKEEEVYVPILERGLSQTEADALFHAMHVAHERAPRP